jgi:hypothetical protein
MNKVTDYINKIGREKYPYLLVGKTQSTEINTNSSRLFIDGWRDADLTYKVTRNDVSGVIENIQWARSKMFIPWDANLAQTQTNYYVYNSQNQYVYLCISNNDYNRSDLVGQVSTVRPTHTTGIQKYSDGFSWLPVYKVTSSMQKFVSSNWIPIISLDNFEEPVQGNTPWEKVNYFCNSSPTTEGFCAVYLNKTKSIPTSSSTYDYYSAGDLYATFESTCSECYFSFNDNLDDDYTSLFYEDSSDIPSSISVAGKLDLVGDLISEGKISTNSPYYSLYQTWLQNGIEDGGVVSVLIDLSDMQPSELITNSESPTISVISSTGSGARIRISTFINESGNYQMRGIELLSHGQDYKDIVLKMQNSSNFNISEADLISRIKINLDRADLLGLDPSQLFNCKNLMTHVTFGNQELNSDSIDFPSLINFYSLVENPSFIDENQNEVIAGTQNTTKYTKEIKSYRTLFKILKTGLGFGEEAALEAQDQALPVIMERPNETQLTSAYIKDIDSTSDPTYTIIKITGDVKTSIESATKIELEDGTILVADEVIVPDHVRQFTGTLLNGKIFDTRTTRDVSGNAAITFSITTPMS